MTDFCGSTLIANALRELEGVSCLYEVRAFAGLSIRKRQLDRSDASRLELDDWQRALRLAIAAMAGARPESTLIVKEWPPANYIISDILRCDERIRAIFLYSDLEDYLNAVFRRSWRREFTRRRTVDELLETDLWPAVHRDKRFFSDGKIAAAHWFVQQQAFLRLDAAVRTRIRSLHSADFFERPVETLAAIARHFRIDVDAQSVGRAFAAVSANHSKDETAPYSPEKRMEEVGRTANEFSFEIAKAVAEAQVWLKEYPIPRRLPGSLLFND